MTFPSKLSALIIFKFAIGLTCVASANVPIVGFDPARDTAEYEACRAANPATTFGATRYGTDVPPETLEYFQCFSTRTDVGLIANVVFCQPGTCYGFSDPDCTKPALPVPVIVPASINIPNAADFSELVVHSAYCGPNTLPRL